MARLNSVIALTITLCLPAALFATKQASLVVQIEGDVAPALKETGFKLMQAVGRKDLHGVKSVLTQLTPVQQIALMSPIYKIAIPNFATITTPLLYSAYAGSLEVFEIFLEAAEAFPEFAYLFLGKTKAGTSAYHLALRAGHRQIEDAILNFVAKHDDATSLMSASDKVASVLFIAADRGDLEGVKKLLNFAIAYPRFADLVVAKNDQKRNALHFAVARNHGDVVRALMESPFRSRFVEDPELIPFMSLKEVDRQKMWRAVLPYAPQLAQAHEETAGLERIGHYEAAFFARDLERVRAFEEDRYPFELDLLNAMYAHAGDVDEQAYLDFICELNPLFYLIIWPYQKFLYWFPR